MSPFCGALRRFLCQICLPSSVEFVGDSNCLFPKGGDPSLWLKMAAVFSFHQEITSRAHR